MKFTGVVFGIACCWIGAFTACGKTDDKIKYDVNRHLDRDTRDTILTNIITYIYRVPRGVRKEDKHLPEYRHLYISQISDFRFVYYHIDRDSTHYFFMIRPARHIYGYKRGVAGRFKVDADLNLIDFEEIFNTPMLSEKEILEKCRYLWEDLMYYGHVDRYVQNSEFIEFPDERTRYDKTLKEWTNSPLEE